MSNQNVRRAMSRHACVCAFWCEVRYNLIIECFYEIYCKHLYIWSYIKLYIDAITDGRVLPLSRIVQTLRGLQVGLCIFKLTSSRSWAQSYAIVGGLCSTSSQSASASRFREAKCFGATRTQEGHYIITVLLALNWPSPTRSQVGLASVLRKVYLCSFTWSHSLLLDCRRVVAFIIQRFVWASFFFFVFAKRFDPTRLQVGRRNASSMHLPFESWDQKPW